ncbi:MULTISPECIES: hypothetical protein [Paenibacillus]|uniref:hypothetical protein n=1 Tax=Paenibacillus TaxID=44249 RepID=UPI002FE16562
MKKWMKLLIPLFLIVILTSFTTTSSSGASRQESEPAAAAPETRQLTVYIEALNTRADGTELTVDPIEWYTGKEAEAVFAKHEPDAGIDGPPDGYYIVNEDEALEHFTVAKDAKVLMQIYDRSGDPADADIVWNEPVSLNKFTSLFRGAQVLDPQVFPYHLSIENGVVTQIVQQYVP